MQPHEEVKSATTKNSQQFFAVILMASKHKQVTDPDLERFCTERKTKGYSVYIKGSVFSESKTDKLLSPCFLLNIHLGESLATNKL